MPLFSAGNKCPGKFVIIVRNQSFMEQGYFSQI